jgi:drug/metabolite transporter (DMT)-like permease
MKIPILFITMITLTVIANIYLKLGASAPVANRIIFGMFGWRTLAGLFAFGCAGLLYAWLLKWLPLNVAQSFTAVQFIAVIAASSIFLSEPISMQRWAGIMLITAGLLVIGLTTES